MKRSKLIIRFLEKNNQHSVAELMQTLFLEWKAETKPHIQIEQYVHFQITEICNFVAELDQYLWHGQFSELGFYVLVKSFFDRGLFEEREQFLNELLADWKRNSPAKNKGKSIKQMEELLSFIRELNKKELS